MSGCTSKDRDIQILLSTYNGEQYLRQQLDSYLAMEHFDRCCVLIRDDGSTDRTRDILRQYEEREEFQVVYGKNMGVIDSYQWLLKNSNSSCSYFAFSDQDDVWLPDKLTTALKQLELYSPEEIILFASCSCVTDAKLNPIDKTLEPIRGVSFFNAMVQNVLPGHTQIFSRALRNCLAKGGLENAESVDWWVYLTASALGTILFSPLCTVLHRQHGNNAVGYRQSFLEKFSRRLRYIRQGKGGAISRQIAAFYALYGDVLVDEYCQEAVCYLKGLQTFPKRISYLRSCRVYRQQHGDDWKFRLLYLLGKYNFSLREGDIP